MIWIFHKFIYIITTDLQVYNTNSLCDHLPVGLLAQTVEKSTAVALQVICANLIQAWIFFTLELLIKVVCICITVMAIESCLHYDIFFRISNI